MATGIEWGWHEDPTSSIGGRTPAQIRTKFPLAYWGRGFVAGEQTTVVDLRPKFENIYDTYLDAGMKCIVSVKTNVTATRNGSWNSRFVELGAHLQSIADKVEVVWWHEPEDDGFGGQAFVHAFNKVYDKIKEGGSNVKVGSSHMAYQWAPNSSGSASIGGYTNTPADWLSYNGVNLKADFVAADVYSGRSFALEHTLGTHPGYVRWKSAFYTPLCNARGSSIPVYLTERGFETPSSTNTTNRSALRVTTIENEFDYLAGATENIKKYIFWSSPGTEDAPGLDLDTAAEDAAIEGMANFDGGSTPPEGDTYEDGVADGRAAMRAEILSWFNTSNVPPA